MLLAGCDDAADSSPGATTQGAAKGEVVVYYSVDTTVADPILDEFERQTGIRVVRRGDVEASKTIGLVNRLRAERAAPAADVFWSGEVFFTIELANEGVLAPYASPATASWPRQFVGRDNRWYGLAVRYRVIVYNTDRVSPAEAPRTLEECLDGRWKGRIMMARPLAGTTCGDVASWFVHYGTPRAREILAGLAANQVKLVGGNATVVRNIGQGQADVGFTDTDDVYAGRRNGWPVAMVPLDQGGAGPLAIPNSVALVAGAPHGEAAGRFIDFVLSGAVERALARSHSGNAPVQPALARQFAANRIAEPLEIDLARVAELLAASRAAAQEILP